MLLELIGNAVPFLGVGGRSAFARDVRPGLGVLPVHLDPFFGVGLAVGLDRLGGTFRLADAAIDALVGMDDEHVFALVEAIHGTDFDAVHVLTFDAGFVDDIRHGTGIPDGEIRLASMRPRAVQPQAFVALPALTLGLDCAQSFSCQEQKMAEKQKAGLVVSAHAADFVWRCGGAVALYASRGYRMVIVCLSFGERGESAKMWREQGMTLEKVAKTRRQESQAAAELLGGEIVDFGL